MKNPESENPDDYKKKPDKGYSEKGGHKKRSLANDERKKGHKEHYKKEEKK